MSTPATESIECPPVLTGVLLSNPHWKNDIDDRKTTDIVYYFTNVLLFDDQDRDKNLQVISKFFAEFNFELYEGGPDVEFLDVINDEPENIAKVFKNAMRAFRVLERIGEPDMNDTANLFVRLLMKDLEGGSFNNPTVYKAISGLKSYFGEVKDSILENENMFLPNANTEDIFIKALQNRKVLELLSSLFKDEEIQQFLADWMQLSNSIENQEGPNVGIATLEGPTEYGGGVGPNRNFSDSIYKAEGGGCLPYKSYSGLTEDLGKMWKNARELMKEYTLLLVFVAIIAIIFIIFGVTYSHKH